MAFDDEKEDVIDGEGLPDPEEDEDLNDSREEGMDMFGGEDPETIRERDWM